MRILIVVLFFLAGFTIQGLAQEQTSTSQTSMSEMGIVTGKVSFGPLRPGPVRENQVDDPETLRKIYQAHKVKIVSEDRKQTVREVEINNQGIYKAELEPGVYILQITPSGFGKLQKQGQQVEVKAGKTVHVDISVDTGMR